MIAAIVPIGMLFWASAKSPERFEPAIIPVEQMIIDKFWLKMALNLF